MSIGEAPVRIVVISAGTSDPSTTRMLADGATRAAVARLREAGHSATAQTIELAPLAANVARSLVSGFPDAETQRAIKLVAAADALIVSTPVYKAGISGLFKSFADLLDNDLLIAKPVLLAATAGSARHAMVADDHLRPLFAFFRAIPAPTSLFATANDWGSPDLSERIDRAAGEFAALVASGVSRTITDTGWNGYRHGFAGNATRAERDAADVDFDTDLMRLAVGGSLAPGKTEGAG